jgi:hypothetical protein
MRAQATATVEVHVIAVYCEEGDILVKTWLDPAEARAWVNGYGGELVDPKELYHESLRTIVEGFNDTVANSMVLKTVKLEVPVTGPNVEVK